MIHPGCDGGWWQLSPYRPNIGNEKGCPTIIQGY